MKRPGEKEAVTYQRHYVLFPEDELKPRIGRVAGRVDVPASGMESHTCQEASVTDQTCAMRLLPGTNIEDFLQGSAARRKKQGGRITLELMFSALKGKPANVTVKQSSDFAELDEGAIKDASATNRSDQLHERADSDDHAEEYHLECATGMARALVYSCALLNSLKNKPFPMQERYERGGRRARRASLLGSNNAYSKRAKMPPAKATSSIACRCSRTRRAGCTWATCATTPSATCSRAST